MTRQYIDKLSTIQVDNAIAKLIGWCKIRKISGLNTYSGINPDTKKREYIPEFSKCPNTIKLAEQYVAQKVGIAYILYLGKILADDKKNISWEQVQQAFAEPHTRAKACLLALQENKSIAFNKKICYT